MTKKEFATQVYQSVKNAIDEDKSDEEIIDDLEIFLDCLEPRDREQFSNWGYDKDKSTVEKCWV